MAYRGVTARIPLGVKGLTGTKNPARVDALSLITAEGVTYESDAIEKELGRVRYNAAAISGVPAPKVVALFDWWATPSDQFLIAATNDGRLLRDDGTGTFPTTLKSGLASDRVVHLVAGGAELAGRGRRLFAFNGSDIVQVIVGSAVTSTNISAPAADWSGVNQPSFGVQHNSRMWAGGNGNDPHRIYYSDADDHEKFLTGPGSTAGSISVYPGEGQKLVGGISWKGRLYLFKFPTGVYWIDDSDVNRANWGVRKLSGSVGLASPWGITAVEDDVLFQSSDALLYTLSATTAFGDARPRSVFDDDDMDVWARDNIDASKLDRAHLVYHPHKRAIILANTPIGSVSNAVRIEANIKRGAPRWLISLRDKLESMAIRINASGVSELISGDDAGFVYRHDRPGRSNAGSPYKGAFQLPHTDFSWLDVSLAEVRKKFEFIVLSMIPQGSFNISIDVLIDGLYVETIVMDLGDVGVALGSFVLGTDKLGGLVLASRRRRLHGTGFRLSTLFSNTGQNENFSISEVAYQFMPSVFRAKK